MIVASIAGRGGGEGTGIVPSAPRAGIIASRRGIVAGLVASRCSRGGGEAVRTEGTSPLVVGR